MHKITTWFFKEKAWLWPLLALALITPFSPELDLAIAYSYYLPEKNFPSHSIASFLYQYGVIPGQILFALSAILLFLGSFFKKWKKWQAPALVLVLTLVIGSGLIVHEILKEHWGRPRPKQVVDFGGQQSFRAYYDPNFHPPEPSKSFACGHCTMGFYFFAMALVAKRLGYRKTFWFGLALALILGIGLSWARISQGGHFLSDTLVSGLVMWITAYACDRIIYQNKESPS